MEKTTKKVGEPAKFKPAGQTEKKQLLKLGGDGEGPPMPSVAECVAETKALGGLYELIDPIDTCAGPIGRFPAVPEALPLHPAIVGFGKRRTGKTYTTRDIFFHCLRHLPFGIVITRTKVNGFWSTYIPDWLVKNAEEMTHAIDVLIKRQKKNIAKWKKEHPEQVAENPDAYKNVPELAAFCILDDIISDAAAMMWNTLLTSLFVEGRHVCITVVILTQYPKGVGPKIRGNADIAMIQPMYDWDQVEMMANMFNGGMDRKLWRQMMNEVVEDNILPGSTPLETKKKVRTLFVSDFENTKNPQIKFHYYEAEDPGPFRLCRPEYWKQQDNAWLNSSAPAKPIDVVEELEEAASGNQRMFH